MKVKVLIVAAVGFSAIPACTRQAEDTTPAVTPTPAPVLTPTPQPSPTPTPTPPPTQTPTPTPLAKRLAPPGFYYLVQRVSITNDAGIIAFVPGTRVSLVQEKPDCLRVSDGEHEFEVAHTHVTNDLDIAKGIGRQDAAVQAAAAAARSAQVRQYHEEQSLTKTLEKYSTNPLKQRLDEIERHRTILQLRLNQVNAELSKLSGTNYHVLGKRKHYSPNYDRLNNQRVALEDQLRALEEQRTLLELQMR